MLMLSELLAQRWILCFLLENVWLLLCDKAEFSADEVGVLDKVALKFFSALLSLVVKYANELICWMPTVSFVMHS